MDTSKKVKIVSKRNMQMVISVPMLNLRKEWNQIGAVATIPFETLQEAMYDPGVAYFFEEGLLYIDDMEVKKELGLEPEDAEEPVNVIDLTDALMKRALGPMPELDFKNWFKKLTYEQKKMVAGFAIENQLINYEKVEFIKDQINVDVIQAIRLNKMDKEPIKDEK